MEKTIFINTKGMTIEDALGQMNEQLQMIPTLHPDLHLKLHSFFIINTMEPMKQKFQIGSATQVMPVVNVTVCLMNDPPAKASMPGMPSLDELTPGMIEQLKYAKSFSCKHDITGQKMQADVNGYYHICNDCGSKVRSE